MKKARENSSAQSKSAIDLAKYERDRSHAATVKKVLNDTNQVAKDIFSILPGAKLGKGEQVLSISSGLRQNKEFQIIDKSLTADKQKIEEVMQRNDGIIDISLSDLASKTDYEREKMRQVSRAEFQQERNERLSRMMPNKNDRSKNNLRSLAFDISGTIEQERIQSQKTFQNFRKKYGW